MRYEEGCARDKTTGELYGCGLGLGNNGTTGNSVIGRAATSAVGSLVDGTTAVRDAIVEFPWDRFSSGYQWFENEVAVAVTQLPLHVQPSVTDRRHEDEYAAAELAAAGIEAGQQTTGWLNFSSRISPLTEAISARGVDRAMWEISQLTNDVSRRADRGFRLWLVENGLHQHWDAAEEAALRVQHVASSLMLFEEEDVDRWFESFPPPVTQPNRLINPIEPKEDPEQSRRMILATAKALDTLSNLLHQTAENLTRQAEQDVAELNKLKSRIEERR